jgi:predicted short-subunit dehydrogenase-like oxidoreductase (DUF2520 family)
MTISIIGTGNVATVLSKKWFTAGVTIKEVYGRNIDKAEILANSLNAIPINNVDLLSQNVDAFILALSDTAIAEIKLPFTSKVVLHTAGSVSKNVLKKIASNFGVIYPIQSLTKESNSSLTIPFAIDANNQSTKKFVLKLAQTISRQVEFLGDEERLKLHTAAVISCNFTNYLYHLAQEYCSKEKINFNLLQPLISQTAQRLQNHLPKHVFTGPAIRKDEITMQKHLQLLQNYPEQREIYKWFSEAIKRMG